MTPGALEQLAGELRAENSVISPHVIDPSSPAALGVLASSGPRRRDRAGEYAGIVECVREGYLLHYGYPRLIVPPDPDLALLAGDYLYAKGLERLATIGDGESVGELSDLITISAQLHAGGSDRAERDAAVLWLASAVAVAVGPSPAHEQAKRAIAAGGPAEPLHAAARESAAQAGLSEQLARASEAVGFSPSYLG